MNSPWSHLKRPLSDAEWASLKAWKQTDAPWRRGDARDGLMFIGYHRFRPGGEWWASAAKLASIRERDRRYSMTPEQVRVARERKRNRYASDPVFREQIKKWANEFRKKKPHLSAADAARRQARIKSQIHPDLHRGVERWHYEQAKRLTKKTGKLHQVDHIIPIAAGGWHHHLNMQVLPCNVNHAKSDNPTWTSSDYLDFRFVPEWLWPEQLVATYRSIMRGEHLGLRAG